MKYTITFTIVLGLHFALIAHIESAECWEKLGKKIYCLADHHEAKLKKNYVNNEQRRSILKGLRIFCAHLIVEDLEGIFETVDSVTVPVTGSISLIDIYDRLKADYAVPMGMASLSYRAGVPATNIEFRFLSASDGNIALNEELESLSVRARKALNYNDGEELKSFYLSVVKNYRDIVYKDGKKFFEHLQTNKPITSQDLYYAPHGVAVDEPLQKLFPDVNIKFLNHYDRKYWLLKYYKTLLIDVELAHAIAQNQHKNRVIVCAGTAHIKRIATALKAMGYIKTDVVQNGHTYYKGHFEPNAIDLDAFFTKHEPAYNTTKVEKTGIDYFLDLQCYFDRHPLVAVSTGCTLLCGLLGIIACPAWSADLVSKLLPSNQRVCIIIQKTLISTVMATTAFGLYKVLTQIRD